MNSNELKLLQELINNDIIKADVPELLCDMKKKKVLELHPYSITPPKNEKTRWQTYIKDETGNKTKISSYTEKGLYAKLYDFYFESEKETLRTIYPKWLEKRKSANLSPRTLIRNEQHWQRYYVRSKIIDVPLHNLTAEMIEDFLHTIIRNFNITSKELGNMKGIFTGCMKLAKKQRLISENPFLDVEINRYACKPIPKQSDSSRVYLPTEKEALFEAIRKEIDAYPESTDAIAISLIFKTAIRIGELAALKWKDINWKSREIHIHRMESRDDFDRPVILEYTKKKSPHGDHFLPLGDYEIELFKKVAEINKSYGYECDDFIFVDEQGRTNIRSIDNLIRKLCSIAKIEVKSAHDIRRTVASELYHNGIAIEIIRDYLGHSDIRTTWGYIYNLEEKTATYNKILTSLNGLNVSASKDDAIPNSSLK